MFGTPMRRRGESDQHENPAWPGLVDLFAFGMIVMLLLWVQTLPEPPSGPMLPPEERERLEQLELLGTVRDELPPSLRDGSVLQGSPPALVVRQFEGKEVFFDSAQYSLSDTDRLAVETAAREISRQMADRQNLVVLVNGTADPMALRPSNTPPRDNLELSALRAAEVSRILVEAGLTGRLQVVGLGEQGTAAGRTPEELREFRRVFLELRLIGGTTYGSAE